MTIKDIILYSILFILFIIVLLALISKSLCNKKSCKNCSICSFGKCKCKDGYKGNDCEIDNRCEGKECKNSGSCVNGDCYCSNGYEGSDCGTKTLMSWNPNLNNGYTLKNNNITVFESTNSVLWTQLYTQAATTTVKTAIQIFFHNTNTNIHLKFNTPYNLLTRNINSLLFNIYAANMKPAPKSLRSWTVDSLPWPYYQGTFYLAPYDGSVNKTTTENISYGAKFIIYLLDTNGQNPPPITTELNYLISSNDSNNAIIPTTTEPSSSSDIKNYMFSLE